MDKTEEFKNILDELKRKNIKKVDIYTYMDIVGNEYIYLLGAFLIENGINIEDSINDFAFDDTDNYQKDPEMFKLFLNDIGSCEMMTDADFKFAFGKLKNCTDESERKEIVNQISERNMRLVVSIAKRYSAKGMDIEDLVQEGYFGLVNAINKYNIDLGYKFSTYASCWIRQAIGRAIAQKSRNIRVPVHTHILIGRINKLKTEYYMKNKKYPTNSELADLLNLPVETVDLIVKADGDTVSLSAPVNSDEDSSELGDFIEDESGDMAFEALANSELLSVFEQAFTKLTPREELIIKKRFGFPPYDRVYTLESIANDFGVTRERIRQIEGKAIRKVKKYVAHYISDDSNNGSYSNFSRHKKR